jgi:hypothetical protein
MALSITSEGIDVAKYMAARGVTAFVLKYRIAHTGEDATEEFTKLYAGKVKFRETIGSVVPLAIADGLAAVTYVRQHASEWEFLPTASASSDFPPADRSRPELRSTTRRKPAGFYRCDLCGWRRI